MAAKKSVVPADEKLESQDFDLFNALAALDRKDYSYLDNLTDEQQKKFVPFMMTHWMSAVKATGGIQAYYLRSVNYHANTHLFNERVKNHAKLQWLMLCAASPGVGKQFHQWIPNISAKVSSFSEPAKAKDIKEYYKKIYPKSSDSDLSELAGQFVIEHKKKCHLAKLYPNMKREDIEALSSITTEEQLKQYEKDRGN